MTLICCSLASTYMVWYIWVCVHHTHTHTHTITTRNISKLISSSKNLVHCSLYSFLWILNYFSLLSLSTSFVFLSIISRLHPQRHMKMLLIIVDSLLSYLTFLPKQSNSATNKNSFSSLVLSFNNNCYLTHSHVYSDV